MTKLLPGYFTHKIKENFISKSAFYLMYMPMQMKRYDDLKQEFLTTYGHINRKEGMIEMAVGFGFGWIGLAHPHGDKFIDEEFIAYEIIGDYKQMGPAYKKVKKDYPQAKCFYNLYLTDPSLTPMAENKTWILIKM